MIPIPEPNHTPGPASTVYAVQYRVDEFEFHELAAMMHPGGVPRATSVDELARLGGRGSMTLNMPGFGRVALASEPENEGVTSMWGARIDPPYLYEAADDARAAARAEMPAGVEGKDWRVISLAATN